MGKTELEERETIRDEMFQWRIDEIYRNVGKKLDAGECIYPAKCIRCELYHNDCPEPGEGLLTELTAECKSFKEVKK